MCARQRTPFSCLAKKRKQKKASRSQGRCAVPCAARAEGEPRKLATLKHARLLIPSPLCCSALPTAEKTKPKDNKGAPWRVLVEFVTSAAPRYIRLNS